MEHEQNKRQM